MFIYKIRIKFAHCIFPYFQFQTFHFSTIIFMKSRLLLPLLLSLLCWSIGSKAQDNTVTVKGTLIAGEKAEGVAKGEPLIGVTVAVKGTTKGTVTDIDGNFKLDNVPVGAILKISYIGFKEEEITVEANRSDYSTALKLDSKQLEEVVAVGYATQKKADITGATVSVDAKEMKTTVNTDVSQALQGRTPGVTVVQSSGSPGAASSVQIRGVGSANGSQPLYVVDGIPVTYENINLINPSDIERVDVLKDASAAAIYGARGANGVVMITTKRGKSGKGRIELDMQYGIQERWRKLPLLDANGYRSFYADTNKVQGVPSSVRDVFDVNSQYYKDNRLDTVQKNTDWQDEVFRRGYIKNYNLSASGGNDYANYSVGLGYFGEVGTIHKSTFERFSMRVNTEYKPKKWFKIGQTTNMSRTINFQGIGGNAMLEAASTINPLLPVYRNSWPWKVDSFYIGDFAGGADGSLLSQQVAGPNNTVNPIAANTYTNNTNVRDRFLGSAYAEVAFTDFLKYKLNAGADVFSRAGKVIGEKYRVGNTTGRFNDPNSVSESRNNDYMWLLEHTLSFSKKFGRHDVSALIGASSQYFFFSNIGASNTMFPQNIRTLGAAGNNNSPNPTGGEAEYSLIGYLGRINYSYSDWLLVTMNFRRDGSSRFGPNTKWGNFPSFSIGLRLTSLDFMKNYQWISDLKVRYGWGRTGFQETNVNNSYYLYEQLITTGIIRYPLGPSSNGYQPVYSAMAPTQGLENPNLKWETVVQQNVGVDFAVLQNSIIMNFDYFDKKSTDMLIAVPIPANSGITNAPFWGASGIYYTNAGSVRNNGFDFGLTYRNERSAFKYSINPNITYVKNRVTVLDGNFGNNPALFGSSGLTRTQVGDPIGSFYGWQQDGIIRDTLERNEYREKLVGTEKANVSVGDMKFKDVDGNGVIDQNDRVYLGKPIPTWSYGLNMSFNYKGVDLRIFFQGVADVDVWNEQRRNLEKVDNQGTPFVNTTQDRFENTWSPTNTSGTMPRAVIGDPVRNNRESDRWVEDASFVRLKSVQLGYNFNEKLLQKVFFTSDPVNLRVYLSGQNLYTFTRYKGYDPELGAVNTPLNTGIDYGTYPQAIRLMGGIQFGF